MTKINKTEAEICPFFKKIVRKRGFKLFEYRLSIEPENSNLRGSIIVCLTCLFCVDFVLCLF